MNLFAHGQELHSDSTSGFEHMITQPHLAVPLFILLIIATYYALSRLGWSIARIVLIELALMLVVGVLLYSIVPAVSILAITGGVVGALFLSFTLIASS